MSYGEGSYQGGVGAGSVLISESLIPYENA